MTLDEYFELPETNSRIDELLDGAYIVTPTPGNIVLGTRTVVMPDIFVIPRPPSIHASWREVERPLLVAEVPEASTAARDRGRTVHLCHPDPATSAYCTSRHNRFTSRISSTDRHRAQASSADPTTIANAWAREIATLSRLGLSTNSAPRGASSIVEAQRETITTAASWP
jgi:hypothetical protein